VVDVEGVRHMVRLNLSRQAILDMPLSVPQLFCLKILGSRIVSLFAVSTPVSARTDLIDLSITQQIYIFTRCDCLFNKFTRTLKHDDQHLK
jgi:hypothetical protein